MNKTVNKEVWKSSSISYLNTLASDVNKLKEKSTRLSNLFVTNDFRIAICDGMLQSETDYQNSLKNFFKEYSRILNEWDEINKE